MNVKQLPTLRARVDELILVVKGLSLEVEGQRKHQSYIGDIVQDLLRSVTTLKTDPRICRDPPN